MENSLNVAAIRKDQECNSMPLTALEYIEAHEPWLLEIFMDKDQALLDETGLALKAAVHLGICPILKGGALAFPFWLWAALKE